MKTDLGKLFPENDKGQHAATDIPDQVITNTGVLVINITEKTVRMILKVLGEDAQKENHYNYIQQYAGNPGESVTFGAVFLSKAGKGQGADGIKKK